MCLGIPKRVLQIKNKKAIVDINGNHEEVGIDLVPGIKEGDYCIINNSFIVKKLSAEEAEETLKLIKERR